MERVVRIESVRTFETRNGNTRFVTRDENGNEYSTFKEVIGERARELEGKSARIEFHETQNGKFTNVYLDRVEPAEEAAEPADEEVEEAAWKTAMDAAPYLVGERTKAVQPDDLFERVKPFKDLVADDIRSDGDTEAAD
jgi:hypothetical protein